MQRESCVKSCDCCGRPCSLETTYQLSEDSPCAIEAACGCVKLYCSYRLIHLKIYDPSITKEEFQAEYEANLMTQCPRCFDWFHMGCLHKLGNSPLYCKNFDFVCPNCSPKP